MSHDLNSIVKNWSAEPGGIRVRKIRGGDGRDFIQLRVDLGVLQLEVEGRPDGERPYGCESMLAWLYERAAETQEDLVLGEEEMEAVSRELMQYYRRRICLMALAEQAKIDGDLVEADRNYRRAVDDADHNMELLDVIEARVDDDDFVEEHVQYRPFIAMHRSTCLAERALLAGDGELAIEMLKAGMREIEASVDEDAEEIDTGEEIVDVSSLTEALKMQERRIRKEHAVEMTLPERLAEAVAREDYERAAELQEELKRRVYPPGLEIPPLPEF